MLFQKMYIPMNYPHGGDAPGSPRLGLPITFWYPGDPRESGNEGVGYPLRWGVAQTQDGIFYLDTIPRWAVFTRALAARAPPLQAFFEVPATNSH